MQDLSVTIIQTPLHWEKPQENLEMFSQKLRRISSSDLIILPEMFNTGFTMNSKELAEEMNGQTLDWMREEANRAKAVIIGSIIIKENGKYFNRLIWMRPDGSSEYYDKRHLFRMAGEHHHFSPGTDRKILTLKGWKILPLVCYDLRFPVWSRNRFQTVKKNELAEAEYDLLIYVANWPRPRRNAWTDLLKARAHENQSYVIGVNRIGEDGNNVTYSGDSVVINAKGNSISTTLPDKESLEMISLSSQELLDFREKFPVGLDADEFTINT